ncbi:hypothetical protein [Pseudonocardia yuanmonensis]|uniref:hypothetical protein n=1 Tax=Pseudonocardia yuanmonensis TaxID=1095914 RepID=UPI0031E95725
MLLTVFQAWRTQVHNRRSVRPLLQLRYSLPQGGTAELVLNSIGLGPAVIVSSRLLLDGKPLGGLDRDSVNRLRAQLETRPHATTFVPGEACPRESSHALLSLPGYDKKKNAEFTNLLEHRLRIEIVYESLYGGEDFRACFPRTADVRT